jgi:two-component system, response regulator / RNA-binding antiterminator
MRLHGAFRHRIRRAQSLLSSGSPDRAAPPRRPAPNRAPMTETNLTVAVIDPSRARAAILEEGLRAAGVGRVVVIPDTAELLERVTALKPDVVVIHLESPSRDILEQMSGVSRQVERPVAMFVDRSDTTMMQAAVDAGISAYVVDGLRAERIKSILDIAILRFNAFARLQRELSEARGELADRKLIERAKGILMNLKGLSEEEAYKQLRRKAMNEKRKIADIARAIVTTADLLG